MSETNPSIFTKLQKVRLLVCDVDGTLTDSAMYYSESGEVLKRFHTRDGMGITLLKKADINVAFLTSENSKIVEARAKKLGIEDIILGSRNKTEDLKELARKLRINLDEVAYIGDDVNDYHAIQLAGVSACPNDATESIKNVATIVLNANGGNGAVREFAEIILNAQNKKITLTENW